jgi:VIT1/CCC1 family predicted Fe2+/Mn2+ transporter
LCTVSRLLVVAFAAYLFASLSHDAMVTWAVVAVAVAAVLGWTPSRGSR